MGDEKLLVVDGSNFLWKAYSAPFEFSSKNGTRLDVITVFLSLLRACIEVSNATRVVVVFDHPQASNYRLEDEEYKSNRAKDFSEAEDSPFHHLDNLKMVLNYLGVAHIESDLAEADDIIFTLVNNYPGDVFIASSDTDFYQCVDDRVKILKVRGPKNIEVLDVDFIINRLGIRPSEYVLFKSLTGDKADNIEGVRGVGPKTAAKIVNDLEFAKPFSIYNETINKNMALIKLISVEGLNVDWESTFIDTKLLNLSNAAVFDSLGF